MMRAYVCPISGEPKALTNTQRKLNYTTAEHQKQNSGDGGGVSFVELWLALLHPAPALTVYTGKPLLGRNSPGRIQIPVSFIKVALSPSASSRLQVFVCITMYL